MLALFIAIRTYPETFPSPNALFSLDITNLLLAWLNPIPITSPSTPLKLILFLSIPLVITNFLVIVDSLPQLSTTLK